MASLAFFIAIALSIFCGFLFLSILLRLYLKYQIRLRYRELFRRTQLQELEYYQQQQADLASLESLVYNKKQQLQAKNFNWIDVVDCEADWVKHHISPTNSGKRYCRN